jgi:hypothetical protein
MLCVGVKHAYLSFSEDVFRIAQKKRCLDAESVDGSHGARSTEQIAGNPVEKEK